MCEDLTEGSESVSLIRVAQLMAANGLPGWPRPRHRGTRGSPAVAVTMPGVANLLERDFLALEAETNWVTDSTEINSQQGKLYQWIVRDLYDQRIVG